MCNDRNNIGKLQNFIKSSKSNSPTPDSGTTSLPPIGDSFMYIETSGSNHCHERIFVSWERIDIIEITNIAFYYNRFSSVTNDSLESMGRFIIQLVLEDIIWNIQYTIAKNSQHCDNSTDWNLRKLGFVVEIYSIKK